MARRFDRLPDYQNPYVFEKNKVDARFEAPGFGSIRDMLHDVRTASLSLNGIWKFRLYRNPSEAADSFYDTAHHLAGRAVQERSERLGSSLAQQLGVSIPSER